MHTDRKSYRRYKASLVPETSRTAYFDVDQTEEMPSLLLQPRHFPLAKDHSEDTHLPALIKANNYTLFTEHGQYDLKSLYEEWRAGLTDYKVPRLCRLDHGRLPALPEQVDVKRRLSQHSASSPPTSRTKQQGTENAPHKTLKLHHGDGDKAGAPNRYECLAKIGQGSYGNVFKCRDKETGRIVAIKKFIETEDNPSIKKIAFREIRILKQLHHPNIVTLLEVFRKKQKLHLVFEYCSRTLLEEIQASKTGLAEHDARKIICQVFQALRVVHRNRFIHRDIKPENILLTGKKTVKLCDFGFARAVNRTAAERDQYTDYVATRWYRAPELLVSQPSYGPAVDIWATGCVFAECISGQPLLPGTTDIDQLYLVRKMFGENSSFPSITTTGSGSVPHHLSQIQPFKKLPSLSREGCEELRHIMVIDPTKRPSANDILQRHYFGPFGSRASGHARKLPNDTAKELTQKAVAVNVKHPIKRPLLKAASRESLHSESAQLSTITLHSVAEQGSLSNANSLAETSSSDGVSPDPKEGLELPVQVAKQTAGSLTHLPHNHVHPLASRTNRQLPSITNS